MSNPLSCELKVREALSGRHRKYTQEVMRTNEIKPVIASMGSMGASGGYYAALGAENIIANPGTMTGSIGVIVKFPEPGRFI